MFTNDLGLVVITNDAGELLGFNILAGGGMGEGGGPCGAWQPGRRLMGSVVVAWSASAPAVCNLV